MEKIVIEYIAHSSPGVLYNRLATASGLAEWFADDVTIDKDGLYHFVWDGEEEVAELLGKKSGEYVKFRWTHLDDDTYFEFRFKTDPLTKELALMITDFVEEGEEEETRQLWANQVDELMRILGG